MRTFKRVSGKKAWVSGVLGGFAYSLDLPASVVRLVFAALCLFAVGLPLVLLYAVCLMAPEWPESEPIGFKE